MKKLLLWGLVLLLLGGLVIFLVAVPAHPRGTAVAQPPKPGPPPETDQLTDRDRKDLDQLIDSKLKGAGEGTPSSKPR